MLQEDCRCCCHASGRQQMRLRCIKKRTEEAAVQQEDSRCGCHAARRQQVAVPCDKNPPVSSLAGVAFALWNKAEMRGSKTKTLIED